LGLDKQDGIYVQEEHQSDLRCAVTGESGGKESRLRSVTLSDWKTTNPTYVQEEHQSDLVSLRVDVLERLKAPIAQSQGESGSALQASIPMRNKIPWPFSELRSDGI
jgi:hypothetical protein